MVTVIVSCTVTVNSELANADLAAPGDGQEAPASFWPQQARQPIST